jgi:hypothetical protein
MTEVWEPFKLSIKPFRWTIFTSLQQHTSFERFTNVNDHSLPEFQSLPRVWFCAERQIKKLSAKKALPRVFYLPLGTEKTLGKEASLPRAKQKALGTEENTRQRFLYQVQFFWLSAKKI